MSFLNITDPEEWDVAIKDYLALKKRLKESNLEERTRNKTVEPVVANNQKMAQDIIEDLIPITEALQEINRNL